VKVKSHSCKKKKQNFVIRMENLHLNNMSTLQYEINIYNEKMAICTSETTLLLTEWIFD